jgi:hypothetical protein
MGVNMPSKNSRVAFHLMIVDGYESADLFGSQVEEKQGRDELESDSGHLSSFISTQQTTGRED